MSFPVYRREATPSGALSAHRRLATRSNRHRGRHGLPDDPPVPKRKEGGLSPRTVRYIATIVHRVFRDALAWQYVARNVADAARPPSARQAREAAPEMSTWTGSELGAFLTWVRDNRYGPASAFLATTGMRRGEALGLRWDDLDLEGGTASIRRASIAIYHKPVVGATTSGRAREIELDGMTVAILRQQWSRQAQERLLVGEGYSNENLLFSLPDGTTPPVAPPRSAPHVGHPRAQGWRTSKGRC
jgi:integrase